MSYSRKRHPIFPSVLAVPKLEAAKSIRQSNGVLYMSSESASSSDFVVTERRNSDRRQQDRRKRSIPVAVERRGGTERRERGERRRQVDPTTCEKDYSDDEIIFMKAMDAYKRSNRRPFPTWSEVLEVLRSLGYRKVEEATALPGLPVIPAADE